MAKRSTGIEKMKKSHSKKTKKRLEAKRAMLLAKAEKRRKARKSKQKGRTQ